MKEYYQIAKTYILNRKELALGVAIVAFVGIAIIAIAIAIISSTPKIVYQPAKACDLLSLNDAKKLLGEKAMNTNAQNPAVANDTAVSRCGYADGNPDKENMIIAAIIVRSGVNDKGVEQNKRDFSAGKPKQSVETIKGIGDNAYFNQKNGQLNILDGRDWMIVSYGIGSAPEANTVEKAIELANTILAPSPVVGKF